MPRRLVEGSDDPDHGFWNRWAQFVVRRPVPVAAVGSRDRRRVVVPASRSTRATRRSRTSRAAGLRHRREVLRDAGISAGVHEAVRSWSKETSRRRSSTRCVERSRRPKGSRARRRRRPPGAEGLALVEAFPATDGSSREAQALVPVLKDDVATRCRERARRTNGDTRRAADIGAGLHRRRLRQLPATCSRSSSWSPSSC